MAKNVLSLQLLRNSTVFPSKADAITGINNGTTQDGVIKLARYTEGAATKTIFGIYHDFGSGNAGYTIYDSYQEVIAAMQDQINELESGSTEAVEKIWEALGGETAFDTANTVADAIEDINDKLEALSGSASDTSATTSVAGAKKYTDDKIAETLDGLDYTDTAVTGSYVSEVNESNGVISVTRVALPSVSDDASAKTFVTSVSETNGQIAVTKGTVSSTGNTVVLTDNADGGINIEVASSALIEYVGDEETIHVSEASNNQKTISSLLTLSSVTPSSTTVKEEYALVDASGVTKGQTVKIYKDSSLVSMRYITDTGDTHYQNLEYTYVDNSGNTQVSYVDMSALVLEAEFASGVTFSNGVAHGVVDPNSETFLTVGEDGFKLDGVQDAIDAAVSGATEGLDASVTGGTTAGTATADHIQVIVDEVNGKLTAVTVTETNIADADKLAALSGKTVTEIGSSNSSISATTAATSDGTVSVDLVTDASKVKMTGFTAADSGFTAITTASTVTEAVKAIETEYIANEQVTSQALNDLEETKLENIIVNGVTGTTGANNTASVTIDGSELNLSSNYAPAASYTGVSAGDSVDVAIGKLEKGLDAAVAGGVQSVVADSGITVDATDANNPKVAVKLSSSLPTGIAENAIKFDSTAAPGVPGIYVEYIDAGTY